jgi:hypothetical protein
LSGNGTNPKAAKMRMEEVPNLSLTEHYLFDSCLAAAQLAYLAFLMAMVGQEPVGS